MKKLMFAMAVVAAVPAFAKIEMGAPFTDGVVLQRGREVPVWGKAAPGSKVTVEFAGAEVDTVACKGGCWKVKLPAMAASKESRVLTVTESEDSWFGATTDAVEVKDVLVGEVWLASGQSNMDCPLWSVGGHRYRDGNGALVASMSQLKYVRCFKSPHIWSVEPRKFQAKWFAATAENLLANKLTAVGFYYARELYLALDVPIGLLDVSWGGTNIDAWTPRCGYENCDKSIQATADYVVKKDFDPAKDKKGPISGPIQQPTVLWNGLVDTFAPMAIRGFIWYQGCHNSGEGQLYRAKLHALYNGWSKKFENPNLKFYLVMLAPYGQNWLSICEAQNQFVKEQPNAAVAVTADVGNFWDIHPNKKEVVAKRLAVHALKRDYGFPIDEDCSPTFKSAEFKDGKAIVDFDHVKNWYVYADNRSQDAAFQVAGADGKWEDAKIVNFKMTKDRQGKPKEDANIDGSKIVLKSDKVAAPVKVRYMAVPKTAGTMYNQASLPLGAFEMK